MPDLQRYPGNLNVNDIVVFLTPKQEARKAQVTSAETTKTLIYNS